MSLEEELQRIMAGREGDTAVIGALAEGRQYVADPIGEIVMPMLAAQR